MTATPNQALQRTLRAWDISSVSARLPSPGASLSLRSLAVIMRVLIFAAFSVLFTACDPIYGVSRSAQVRHLPDMGRLKQHIVAYPEIDSVTTEAVVGGRPLTLTGIKPANKVFYVNYSGGNDIRGSLFFVQDFRGEVNYSQSLICMHVPPPQSAIDATWPVMMRIERDLETDFRLYGLRTEAKTHVHGVTLPQ